MKAGSGASSAHYGRPGDQAAASWRRRFRRGAYLTVLGGLFGLLSLAATFVTVMDPYDLYPWGPRPQLSRDRYDPNALPWLLNIVAGGAYDTLVIGGSTAQQFEAGDVERELGAKRAFVFTYSGPKPRDLDVVLAKVAAAPGLDRVILSYDLSYLSPADLGRESFPFALYDASPLNDLRDFGLQSLTLSARLAAGREFYAASWNFDGVREDWSRKYQRSLAPESAVQTRLLVEAWRSRVDSPTTLTCQSFPAIARIPVLAAALAKRGVSLDIVIPPYSYAMYFDYLQREKRHALGNGPALATLLLTRRCLLEAVSDDENVRVFAYDLNPAIVEDMANYRDTVHLFGPSVGRTMLKGLRSGQDELTLAEFDAYQTELRRRVRGYRYFNSKVRQSPTSPARPVEADPPPS